MNFPFFQYTAMISTRKDNNQLQRDRLAVHSEMDVTIIDHYIIIDNYIRQTFSRRILRLCEKVLPTVA